MLTVLAYDHVAFLGGDKSQTPITRDFPVLSGVYHILGPSKYPPTFKKVKACDYHYYVDVHPDVSTKDENE